MSVDGFCPDCDMPVPAGVYTCPHCGQPLDFPKPADPPRRRKGRSRPPAPGCTTTLVALLLVVLTACSMRTAGPTIPTEPPGGALVAFRSHVVAVELAVNDAERQKGLMDRKTLGENNGMLFLFPPPGSAGDFYMYRTLVPLSVAFLHRVRGETFKVIRILDMTPCHSTDPKLCPLYDPKATYDAALEVNSGWFVRNGVHVGSTARVGRAPSHT